MQTIAAEAWGYVSGWCASLEARLLGKDYFMELLRGGSAEGAYGKISKTSYVELFPSAETLHDYDRRLERHFRDKLVAIQTVSPPNDPAEIFLYDLQLQDVHELIIRQGVVKAGLKEVERLAVRLRAGFKWLRDLSADDVDHRRMAAHPVRALSLMVDAAFLNEMNRLAGQIKEIRPYLDALVAIGTFKVLWRAVRSGMDRDWLKAFFFKGSVVAPDFKTITDECSVIRLIRGAGLEKLRLPEDDEFAESFGREADNYLTNIALEGMGEVFGPARVLSYLRRLWAEHFNMRLCLSAVITPLDRDEVRMRIRNG